MFARPLSLQPFGIAIRASWKDPVKYQRLFLIYACYNLQLLFNYSIADQSHIVFVSSQLNASCGLHVTTMSVFNKVWGLGICVIW